LDSRRTSLAKTLFSEFFRTLHHGRQDVWLTSWGFESLVFKGGQAVNWRHYP
jgi:hypothetical protein